MQVFRHKKISPPFANVLAWWGEGEYIDRCNYFLLQKYWKNSDYQKFFP